ncbi:MAG: ATP-binding cassette domain-containing protein [Bifidobacterium tibiigranuli]|uniref:ABC transporter ATP-binding protein n=1 Tax=Bifidobacterium tibiigranuli TaxID=2172043 RepID=UPI0026ED03A9|nr:ABC transporter ATP-binding protein [Bifidobacterium tibiigranuli]MCI1672729.1 ATP-binding cassette domain-containing protein [Bifidobacterium tibiigranuli]MCI1712266.1 ATP-binding cassette domain-containing protein [Bifidobacterium tibiigranuli]MCI1833264.1 ATP-binding cassette domain-containing protein [Bifidobacterium tibiigranuli]
MIRADHINKRFSHAADGRQALSDVSLQIRRGESVAIIGGSGSGKSTLIRILLGLDSADSGTVEYRGQPVRGKRSPGWRLLRRESGLVLQNPFTSLDPRWTVARSIAEPLRSAGVRSRTDVTATVESALQQVGLESERFMPRYPIDLSGGQAQRVAIARAIVAGPSLLVADEPMSAIDVAARLQILESFKALRRARPGMALIMVSHDLGVVRRIAERIIVLHEGVVVESGPTAAILERPQHDYTKRLIDAASL